MAEERLVADVAVGVEHMTRILHEAVAAVNPDERSLADRYVNAAAQIEGGQRTARGKLAGKRRRKDRDARQRFRCCLDAQEAGAHARERADATQPWSDRRAKQSFQARTAERRITGKVTGIVHDFGLERDERRRMPPDA